jgi:NADH-quinone oxidoreductase subunit J
MNDPQFWHAFFFYIYAALACGFAIGVVFTTNIVRMALYLIFSLGATSGLYYLAGQDFVGAMQLMIYVGGTLVLLIFGVMLTAQNTFINLKTDSGQWISRLFVGGSLLAILLWAAFQIPAWIPSNSAEVKAVLDQGIPPTSTAIGKELLGKYLLPFEIVSIHLLVVLVGAAYLARAKKRVK